MPLNISTLEKIGNIASQACLGRNENSAQFSGQNVDSDSLDEGLLLTDLEIKISETQSMGEGLLINIESWCVPSQYQEIHNSLSSIWRLPQLQHPDLSGEQNSRLRVLLTVSNFAYFLQTQENDEAYQGKDINSLQLKTLKVACALRILLPSVSDENIKNYTRTDLAQRQIDLINHRSALKRLVFYIVLKQMVEMFQAIEISLELKTVSLP